MAKKPMVVKASMTVKPAMKTPMAKPAAISAPMPMVAKVGKKPVPAKGAPKTPNQPPMNGGGDNDIKPTPAFMNKNLKMKKR